VRHLPTVVRHDPAYVLANGLRMLRHTFRGTSLRTWLGLEDERTAFRRYKDIRRREREFFPETSAAPGVLHRHGEPSPAVRSAASH
jgi:hypothetical protein